MNDMGRPGLIFILLFSLSLCPAFGQSLDELRSSLEKLEEEKMMTEELRSKTLTDLSGVVKDRNLLKSEISTRRNIITNLEKQTDRISIDMEDITDTISLFENQLSKLRREYSEMVYDAYKNYKVNNFMVFLFAAKDFNDVNRRITYMRQYNRMRQRKAEEIKSTSYELNKRVTEMVVKKADLDDVRKKRSDELTTLGKKETELNGKEQTLRRQDAAYSTTLQQQERQRINLQNQIATMIAELSKDSKSTERSAAERELDIRLTGEFDQNQGKLPFPVKGVITDKFGTHPHPTQRGVSKTNNGIDIASASGAEVRCVFEGTVSLIFFDPWMKNSIIVKHGNYFTVYSNLENVSVKKGDKVALNQVLGRLDRSANDNSNFLHFELWKERPNLDPTKLDPEKWLRK